MYTKVITVIMFITAVCVLFLIKLRWPGNKSLYNYTLFRFLEMALRAL